MKRTLLLLDLSKLSIYRGYIINLLIVSLFSLLSFSLIPVTLL